MFRRPTARAARLWLQHSKSQSATAFNGARSMSSSTANLDAWFAQPVMGTSITDIPCVDVMHKLPAADVSMDGHGDATTLDVSAFPGSAAVDPFAMASQDMQNISSNIRDILGVDHPVLSTVAKYFFELDGGKKIRPTMVVLMARAMNSHMKQAASSEGETKALEAEGEEQAATELMASQVRLAEITEMIHTASLLHDDVIDMADTRRGVGSVNHVFGNKLAVLAGDFLLARASVCLARLRNVEVVELLSTVIEHLVKGEVMQMSRALRNEKATAAAFDVYMTKTYYKTASLMANSCQASAYLADYPHEISDIAFKFGKHIGLAFQIIDDLLDFEATSEALGKPALNDLKQGLTTAPVLYASRDYPSLLHMIERKFEAPGDVEQAVEAVTSCDALTRTRALAVSHAQIALDSLEGLKPSPERDALAAIASRVINRTC